MSDVKMYSKNTEEPMRANFSVFHHTEDDDFAFEIKSVDMDFNFRLASLSKHDIYTIASVLLDSVDATIYVSQDDRNSELGG